MKFRNLGKFTVKPNTYLHVTIINGMKQGILISSMTTRWYEWKYYIYLDDMKHSACYEFQSYQTLVWCCHRDNIIKEIIYACCNQYITLYKTYKNNQLHGKIFEKQDDLYHPGMRPTFTFTNYRHGWRDGYCSAYIVADYIKDSCKNNMVLELFEKIYYAADEQTFKMTYKSDGRHEFLLYLTWKTYVKQIK